MEATKSPSIIRLILTLFIITVIVAGLLGVVNYVTKDRIAELKAEKSDAAKHEVLDSQEYLPLEYTGDDKLVKSIWSAGDGWVVEVIPSGFGGEIDMMVGVDSELKVTGISIVSMAETSGLGANASQDYFRSRFVGRTEAVLTKDGGDIDALTGATVTSRAVAKGVNAALAAAGLMKGGVD